MCVRWPILFFTCVVGLETVGFGQALHNFLEPQFPRMRLRIIPLTSLSSSWGFGRPGDPFWDLVQCKVLGPSNINWRKEDRQMTSRTHEKHKLRIAVPKLEGGWHY